MKKFILPIIAGGFLCFSCGCGTCGKKAEEKQMKKQESTTEKKMNNEKKMQGATSEMKNNDKKPTRPTRTQNGKKTAKRW